MPTYTPLLDSKGRLIRPPRSESDILNLVQENVFYNPTIILDASVVSGTNPIIPQVNYDNFNQGVFNILLDNGASKILPTNGQLNSLMTKTQFLAESLVEERVIRIGDFYYFHLSGDEFSVENSNGVYTPIFIYESGSEASGLTATPLSGDYNSVEEIYDNLGRVILDDTSVNNTFKVFELKQKCKEIYNASTNTYGFKFVFLKTFLTLATTTYSSGQVDVPANTTLDHALIPMKFFTNAEYMWDKNGTKYYLVNPSAQEPGLTYTDGTALFLLLKQGDNTWKPLQTNSLLPRTTLINNIDRLAIGASNTAFNVAANLAESNQSTVILSDNVSLISMGAPEIRQTLISQEGLGATIYWKKGNNSAYTRVQLSTSATFTPSNTIIENKVTLLKKICFSVLPNTTYYLRLTPLNLPTDTVINASAVTSTLVIGAGPSSNNTFTKFDKRVTSIVPGNVVLSSNVDYFYDLVNKTYWTKASNSNFMFRIIINDGEKDYVLRSDEIYTKAQLLNNPNLRIKNRGESETDYYLPISNSGLDTTRFIRLQL